MNVNFRLKGASKTQPNNRLISVEVFTIYGQIRLSTKEHILVSEWNAKKMRARASANRAASLNQRLDFIEGKIIETVKGLVLGGETLTMQEAAEKVKVAIFGEAKKADLSKFVPYLDAWIGSLMVSTETKKGYRTVRNNIVKFLDGREITLKNITFAFYSEYRAWYAAQGYKDGGFDKCVKMLRSVMKYANDNGAVANADYLRFKRVKSDTDSIALDSKELDQLTNYEHTERLQPIVDLFVFACNVGLRISDYKRLDNDSFKLSGGRLCLSIKAKKTKKNTIVPLNGIAKTIYEKYGGELPKVVTEQTFNKYIKQAAKDAGLTAAVKVSETRGGTTKTVTYQKWELISSHTARRTFATSAYRNGVALSVISAILGHATEKQTQVYLKLNEEDNAKLAAKYDFFN